MIALALDEIFTSFIPNLEIVRRIVHNQLWYHMLIMRLMMEGRHFIWTNIKWLFGASAEWMTQWTAHEVLSKTKMQREKKKHEMKYCQFDEDYCNEKEWVSKLSWWHGSHLGWLEQQQKRCTTLVSTQYFIVVLCNSSNVTQYFNVSFLTQGK